MTDYKKKTQSAQQSAENLVGANYLYVDGGVTTPVTVIPSGVGGRLLRVILNTNGATLILKNGARFVGVIATDAPEGTFNYGVYCENGLTVQASGPVDATVIFG